MSAIKTHITIFEHQSIWTHKGEERLSLVQLKAFHVFYGEKGVPYYSLIHNGVKFCEYVGVIQIGNLLIEILPKADKNGIADTNLWRKRLIDMLRSVGIFNIHAPSYSQLALRHNSILDLYFELFIKEVNYLIHQGLIKKYRKKEGNTKALTGSLKFAKHIQQNVVHQERFYVKYTTYDTQHLLHSLLYKVLRLLQQINTNSRLNSSIANLLLCFPEMPSIAVNETTFNRIIYNRKTESYRNAIEIARLLLLNYHPDVSKGRNDVLALLFDMNLLWEQFVYTSLQQQFRKQKLPYTITTQTSKYFWKPQQGSRSSIRPDIVIKDDKDNTYVLDTKWKQLYQKNPSPDDLRQLYVYLKYFDAQKVALVYPSSQTMVTTGRYYAEHTEVIGSQECSMILISVGETIMEWQEDVLETIKGWIVSE